jgi:DNA-directed RNA polymerase subunit RPC12/RpoP
MGIYILPEQKYRCSKCGSIDCVKFSMLPEHIHGGHYEGIHCNNCGHQIKWYIKSIFEKEMESGISYTYNPNEPREF